MMLRPGRLVPLCGLIPTLVVAVVCLSQPSSMVSWDHRAYDTLVSAVPTTPPTGRVVIVDVDERSLTAVGQWPWRRDVIAGLITQLRNLGADTIALDIVFAEAERHLATEASPDVTLAETLREGGVVLGYGLTFDDAADRATPCVQHPLAIAVVSTAGEPTAAPFFRATNSVCSLPALTEAAGRSGFLNAAPDPDGILRRVPVLLEFEGRVYPSLALAAVRGPSSSGAVLRVQNVNAARLDLQHGTDDGPGPSATAVPLDGRSNLLVRYRGGKHTFPYLSAVDVLEGRVPSGRLAGKVVIVGTTALGTREVVATPLDTLFTGVEVQATVADNLLRGDFFQRPEHGVALEALAVAILGSAATFLVVRFGLTWGLIGMCALVAAMWGASVAALSTSGHFVSPLFASLNLLVAGAAMMAARVVVERGRADREGQEKAASQRLMVQALLSLLEIRDPGTGRHSRRTQTYARVLAEALATHPNFRDYLTPQRIELLSALAPLHDIGKMAVPGAILNKPGPLTPDELAEMRKHPAHGRDVIENAERAAGVRHDLTLAIAKDIVFTHHEKWDGQGYPQGLGGTNIPIPGRVMALVDVYDAIRSPRAYHRQMTVEEATALINRGRGTHFDPDVVDAFLTVATTFHRLSEAYSDAERPMLAAV